MNSIQKSWKQSVTIFTLCCLGVAAEVCMSDYWLVVKYYRPNKYYYYLSATEMPAERYLHEFQSVFKLTTTAN